MTSFETLDRHFLPVGLPLTMQGRLFTGLELPWNAFLLCSIREPALSRPWDDLSGTDMSDLTELLDVPFKRGRVRLFYFGALRKVCTISFGV